VEGEGFAIDFVVDDERDKEKATLISHSN